MPLFGNQQQNQGTAVWEPQAADGRLAHTAGANPAGVFTSDLSVSEYVLLGEAGRRIAEGRTLVSTTFVVPYPPGFPVLVPGQVVSKQILYFLAQLDVKEIHGYNPDLGLSVFTDAAVARATAARPVVNGVAPVVPTGPAPKPITTVGAATVIV